MTNNKLDTILMNLAGQRVTGRYYGSPYHGMVTSTRQHSINLRELVTIKLDNPTSISYCGMVINPAATVIIISADDIEQGKHTVKSSE